MRRWNGWGDTTITYPLHQGDLDFLEKYVGAGRATSSVKLAGVIAKVPQSRLPDHALITTDAEERIRHSTGQSLPDWLGFHSGHIPVFSDGVSYPLNNDDVRDLLDYARANDVKLIPYGGGTSVVGHINPQPGDAPVLTVDMCRISALKHIDAHSGLATFGAGINGPELESQLRARGFVLGHYPQSFELSTLGGWIATRSSGQQSLHYGRIEHLFRGGHIETPAGTIKLPAFPASAAGPDLRELILGSEGRLGIITEATVRISLQPQKEEFRGIFFPSFAQGMNAVRTIAQQRLPLSSLRLSTATETITTLALAGKERAISKLERYLSWRGVGDGKAMLMMAATGDKKQVKYAINAARNIASDYGAHAAGSYVSRTFGNEWHKNRFHSPYLRNTLWEHGYVVDTLETATTWENVPIMIAAIENALHSALEDTGERVHAFTHLSHVYPEGSSIYTTYVFRLADNPDETMRRWQLLKKAASKAVVTNNGTISHQHGVGTDHAPYLAAEKGELGMSAIRQLCQQFDPETIMNPGKLFE
jgi:alkyldihydroxyacetonephosphate synthase